MSDGRLRYRETVIDGIENAPRAFLGLLRGENIGKMLVKVGPSDNKVEIDRALRPRSGRLRPTPTTLEEVLEEPRPLRGENALGMELHALDRMLFDGARP